VVPLFLQFLEAEMKKITDAYYSISKSHNFISELRSIRKHYQGRSNTCLLLQQAVRKNTEEEYILNEKTLIIQVRISLTIVWERPCWAKHLGKKKLIAETGAGQHGCSLGNRSGLFWIGMRNPYGRGKIWPKNIQCGSDEKS